MVSPRQVKIEIKNKILMVLKRDTEAKLDSLISSFKLETGFGEKVIADIMQDLANVGLLSIEDNIVTLTDKGKGYGVAQ